MEASDKYRRACLWRLLLRFRRTEKKQNKTLKYFESQSLRICYFGSEQKPAREVRHCEVFCSDGYRLDRELGAAQISSISAHNFAHSYQLDDLMQISEIEMMTARLDWIFWVTIEILACEIETARRNILKTCWSFGESKKMICCTTRLLKKVFLKLKFK